jgi:putative transcriptional regulator
MSTRAFDRIKAGLDDAIAHAAGDSSRARLRAGPPQEIDVVAVRAKLGLTQAEFARLCGVSVATLRNWEQGRRRPAGPSRALLFLVDAEPRAALRAIQRHAA